MRDRLLRRARNGAVPVVPEDHLDPVVHADAEIVEALLQASREEVGALDRARREIAARDGGDVGHAHGLEEVELSPLVRLREALRGLFGAERRVL